MACLHPGHRVPHSQREGMNKCGLFKIMPMAFEIRLGIVWLTKMQDHEIEDILRLYHRRLGVRLC